MDIRLRFLTAEIAILTAIATLFNTQSPEWTKVYERRLYAEMALNLWRGGNEQKESEEAIIPGMATICETMVEAEDPRTPLAAEAEGYSQRLAQNAEREAVNEQKAVEKISAGADSVPARAEGITKTPVVRSEEVVNEPQTSEEAPTAQQTRQEEVVEAVPESSPAPIEPAPPEEPTAVYQASAPLYLVEGEQLDPGVAEYLYQRLCEVGIGWFYEYALCLAYQESSFNPLAENVNGRDKGLYQFRVEFHPGLAWQNPYAQTDLFVSMMAARAAAGCDVYSMISRHNTSDYCPEVNMIYLTQVLSHFPTLQRIR